MPVEPPPTRERMARSSHTSILSRSISKDGTSIMSSIVTCVQRKWVWLRPDGPAVFFYTMCRLTDEQALLEEMQLLTDDRQSMLPLPTREIVDVPQPREEEEDPDEEMSETELAMALQSDEDEEDEEEGAETEA